MLKENDSLFTSCCAVPARLQARRVRDHRRLDKILALDVLDPLVRVGARLELGDAHARAVELADGVLVLAVVIRVRDQVRRPDDRERLASSPRAGRIFGRSSSNSLRFSSANFGSSGV